MAGDDVVYGSEGSIFEFDGEEGDISQDHSWHLIENDIYLVKIFSEFHLSFFA